MQTLEKLVYLLENNLIEEAHDLFLNSENELKDNSTYWNLRGYLYTAIQEYTIASQCFENSINIDISNFDAHYNYAYVLETQEKLDEAAIHYGMAYKYTEDIELKKSMENIFENHKGLRNIFLSVAYGTKKTFVITSNVNWGIVYQRHHHIARALAKLGNEVYYIESPIESEFPTSKIDKNILNTVSKEYKIIDNVKICSTFEGTFNGEVITSNYLDMIKYIIDNELKDTNIILLNYNTHIIEYLKNIQRQNKYIIYECVDDNTDTDYAFWSNDKSIYDEQKTMNLSDNIITTSTTLYLKHSIFENRNNVSLIRNAVNKEDFIIEEYIEPQDIKNIPKPRVCYTGALYNRLDIELLFSTAKNNPNVSFVIIGFGDESLLKDKPNNVYYLGARKHSELKHYLKSMNIGVIPFKADMIGVKYCDSIKHYEYLAAGLPVIVTDIPESGINKPYTYIVSNEREFSEAINKALSIKIDNSILNEFLYSNSWLERASNIVLLSEDLIQRKNTLNVDIHSRLKCLAENHSSKFNESLLQIINNKNHKYFEEELMFKNTLLDQLYLKRILASKDYNKLEQYLLKALNENANKFIKNTNKDNIKNLILEYCGYILSKEYLNAYKTYNLLNQDIISKLIDYKIDINIVEFTIKSKNKYFETTSKQGKYNIYLIDLTNEVCEDFKKNLCSDLNSLNIVTKETINDFLNNIKSESFKKQNTKIIIPFNDNFVKAVRIVSSGDLEVCYVASELENSIILTEINKDILDKVKNKEYLKTISVFKKHSADGNVEAILRNIPKHLKNNIQIRIISPDKIYSLEESIITPLVSSITVSGFAVFGNYPKHTYNIELWHGGLGLKTCGLMDKVNKSSGGTIECFEKIDKICLASYMNCVQFTSCFAIPENKYEITGLPRTDLLLNQDSRIKLEKLLNIKDKNKVIIFNMPTFHISSNSNRVEGNSNLSDYFKLPNFNYKEFNKFLKDNNMICVSKAHHNEEELLKRNDYKNDLENLYFIDNKMLDKENLNLYDVLGGADILITDYSSVYGDFLFMDKPTVFSIYDIDEYRESRGIALEPFDFWTAGPKAKSQKELQEALLNSNNIEYKKQRKELQKVFFKYIDKESTNRVWSVIEEALKEIK